MGSKLLSLPQKSEREWIKADISELLRQSRVTVAAGGGNRPLQ